MNFAGSKKIPFIFGIDFEVNRGFFINNPFNQSDILFDLNGICNSFTTTSHYLQRFNFTAVSKGFYENSFKQVREGLLLGNSFLLNLTIKTPIDTNLSLKDIFIKSRSRYRLYVCDRFVCFSPETFVKIENGKIYSYPMKGTIDASIPNAEQIILNNYKEQAEHFTIVDLIRNDINRVSENVKVNRFRYLEKVKTNKGEILQVSSEIEGKLPVNYHSILGDIIFELLPAGSISGAPKQATLNIINMVETQKRNFYTGVFGYFDGEKLDSAVLIRFIEKENEKLFFRSGGGITINSSLDEEYEEVMQKIYLPFNK